MHAITSRICSLESPCILPAPLARLPDDMHDDSGTTPRRLCWRPTLVPVVQILILEYCKSALQNRQHTDEPEL